MRIIIYNTNSLGGNYSYSTELARAYNADERVESAMVFTPGINNGSPCMLLSDKAPLGNKFLRKLYFLYRSIVNPLRFYNYLKGCPPSIVILNDYDQSSAPIWARRYRRLKYKHTFALLLHDPDRDNYLPSLKLSISTMKQVMNLAHIAFYHEILPDKPYYNNDVPKVKVPHGLYHHKERDKAIEVLIEKQRNSCRIMSILGNVRDEKNYTLAIQSLPMLPGVKLLVAGAPANARISIAAYTELIAKLGVQEQVIWIDRYVTDSEMQSVISKSDIILLVYKESFNSQSGILNLIAPHKKQIIAGKSTSPLAKTVEHFNIGIMIPLEIPALVAAVNSIGHNNTATTNNWEEYFKYASWSNHVNIAIDSIESLAKKLPSVP